VGLFCHIADSSTAELEEYTVRDRTVNMFTVHWISLLAVACTSHSCWCTVDCWLCAMCRVLRICWCLKTVWTNTTTTSVSDNTMINHVNIYTPHRNVYSLGEPGYLLFL